MSNDDLNKENIILKCENHDLKMKVMEMEHRISELQIQACKKHNERKAGRKKYQDNDVVRCIFLMYSQGKSYQQIADKLNCENVPTKTGRTWVKSSVRFIINNKSYVEGGIISEKEYNLDFS